MRRILVTLAALVLLAAPALADNLLDVSTTAALEGTYGLGIVIQGGDNLTDTYVVSEHPEGETTYNFSFRIHPGTLNMDATNAFRSFVIGNVRKATPDRNFLLIYLMKGRDGWWSVQANTRRDNGTFPPWQNPVPICHPSPTSVVPCSSIASGVEIRYEWAAATSSGANNGFLRVYRDGNLARSFLNLDNDTQTVESAWFGAIFMANGSQNSVATQANGTFYFDSFVSAR